MARSVVCELFKANEASWYITNNGYVQGGVTPVSLSANTAVYIPAVGRTMLVGVTPTSADAVVTVSAGDGVSAMNDITFEAKSAKITFVQLDTSSFEIIDPDDENVGCIKITSDKAGTLVACNAL